MNWTTVANYDVTPGHVRPPSPAVRHFTAKGRLFTAVPRDFAYTWPGRFTPRKHQRETFRFLVTHDRCFCLDGLGTGKTLSAIWAMDHLMNMGVVRRALIVAPLSICDYVWGRELWKTLTHRRYVWLKGTRAQKSEMAENTCNQILIINPESLHLIRKLPEVDLIIVDEMTKFKNHRSRRYRALKLMAEGRRLWLLSGTPAPQSPLDAYGPIRLVRPERLSFLQWRDWTMSRVSEFVWVPRPGAENIIAKWMQPAIRHKREDCFDMPDVAVLPLEVDLTKEQETAIKSFREEAAARFNEDGVITATTAAAVLSKCLQVMGGGVYGENEDGRYIQKVNADPFYEAVESVVEQADTPVLIFAPFRSTARAIYDRLAKGFKAGIITGDTKEADRSAYFDRVQSGTLDALVAVAGTMSHGLTLTGARYILWALPPYSFEEYDQANGRVIRSGQRNDVVIYQLVQNNLARDLFKRLETKEKLQTAVLNLIEGGR